MRNIEKPIRWRKQKRLKTKKIHVLILAAYVSIVYKNDRTQWEKKLVFNAYWKLVITRIVEYRTAINSSNPRQHALLGRIENSKHIWKQKLSVEWQKKTYTITTIMQTSRYQIDINVVVLNAFMHIEINYNVSFI